jgi:hypothetical protein
MKDNPPKTYLILFILLVLRSPLQAYSSLIRELIIHYSDVLGTARGSTVPANVSPEWAMVQVFCEYRTQSYFSTTGL